MIAEQWQNSADAYARSFAHLCAGTVGEILKRLDSQDGYRRLLDIGAGTGTVAAAANSVGATVVGMDKEHSMATFAAPNYPEIAFVRAALPHLPCADQSFHAITANFVINHTPDPRAAIRELLRAVRVDGQLVATIWTSEVVPLNEMWNEVMRIAAVSPPEGTRLSAAVEFERSVDGFTDLLVDVGFDQVDCQETHWNFEIDPAELWSAVEAGIAVIGQTCRSQDEDGRQRM